MIAFPNSVIVLFSSWIREIESVPTTTLDSEIVLLENSTLEIKSMIVIPVSEITTGTVRITVIPTSTIETPASVILLRASNLREVESVINILVSELVRKNFAILEIESVIVLDSCATIGIIQDSS